MSKTIAENPLQLRRLKNNRICTIYLLLGLALFFFGSTLQAQLGREHYLPPFHSKLDEHVADHYLYLSTPQDIPFPVSITNGAGTPIAGSPFILSNGNPARITLGASVDSSNLFVTAAELNTPLNQKGLLLSADQLFYASFRTRTERHAGYLTCKGASALGTSFRLGSIPHDGENETRNFFASIMASADQTRITISDYDPGVQFVSGTNPLTDDQIEIVLDRGESYVVSGYTDVAANLTGFVGALVNADKPIVVNTGNFLGSFAVSRVKDIAIDQIIPIADVGTEYIAIRGNGNDTLEQLLVIATADDTNIYVNGATTPYNDTPLDAGDYLQISALEYQGNSHANMHVSSSAPIYLYQSLGGSIDHATTGFNFIPPLSCFFLKQIGEIPDIERIGSEVYEGNMAIVTHTGAEVRINGNTIAQNPENVMGTSEWETYRVDNLSGNVSVTSTAPLSLAVYGASDKAGFSGYYSSFGVLAKDTAVQLCSDAPVDLLSYVDGFPDTNGTWTPALSSGSSTFDPLVDPEGVYNYVLSNSCTTIDIDITVSKTEPPRLEGTLNYPLCDTDSDGLVRFDLQSQIERILDGQTNISLTFHANAQDAENWLNPLPLQYESSNATIYVRMQNQETACVTIGTLDLIVASERTTLETAIEVALCTEDPVDLLGYATIYPDTGGTWSPALASGTGIFDPTIDQDGNYAYTLTNDCTDTTLNITVTTNGLAELPTDLVYRVCDNADDGDAINGQTNFDLDSQIALIHQQIPESSVSFHRSETDAINGINPIASPYYSSDTAVYIRAQSDANCIATGILSLQVMAIPEIPLPDAYERCKADEPLILDATIGALGDYSYRWNPTNTNIDNLGNESALYEVTEPGTYTVSVVNLDIENTCITTKTITVTEVLPPTKLDVLGGDQLFVAQNTRISLRVTTGVWDYEYRIDDGDWQSHPVFTNIGAGTHEAFARSINGCETELFESFDIIPFRPFFTPNADGFHDYWHIDELPAKYDAVIRIFDRYGQLLKQLNPQGQGWDGTYNGNPLPATDYWIHIEYTHHNTRKEFSDHISLIR